MYFHTSTLMRSRNTESTIRFATHGFSRTIKPWTYCFDSSFRYDRNDRNWQFRSDFHPTKSLIELYAVRRAHFPIFVKYENWNYEKRQNYARGWGGASFWRLLCRGGRGQVLTICHWKGGSGSARVSKWRSLKSDTAFWNGAMSLFTAKWKILSTLGLNAPNPVVAI